jgi:hypothetical protein
MLNSTLKASVEVVEKVPRQRLVFFTKHVVKALALDLQEAVIAEILKALLIILPILKEIYETFWEDSIKFLVQCLRDESIGVPLAHAALKLFTLFRILVNAEPNDDFFDAWSSHKEELSGSVVQLFKKIAGMLNPNSHALCCADYSSRFQQAHPTPRNHQRPH